ncbi:MAG: histidine kinase [Eubacteriales bacterium]|nr:histidine kinase [Eubacteriales bacterium]
MTVGVYAKAHNRMIDSIYYLEEFFDELLNIQNTTIEYVFLESEKNPIEYTGTQEKIQRNFEALKELNIQGNYHRNMRDLGYLLDNYREMYEKVINQSAVSSDIQRTTEIMQNHMEIYGELDNVYQAVVNKKGVLYHEVHQYFRQQRTELKEKSFWLGGSILGALIIGFLIVRQNTRRLAGEIILPVRNLTKRAEWVRDNRLDELTPDCEEETAEFPVKEIEVLSSAFTAMLQRIQQQVAELKESMAVRERLKEQEMENLRIINLLTSSELRCLQMQMNPHFLFNTLNMIQQTVYLDKKEKTTFLLKETASFLRYSLDYIGKNVPLQKELMALGNYVSLQEERLGERILFEFELDESVNEVKIPCLILQPLVENSIIHGVAHRMSGALIRICTKQSENKYCCIFIEDNGIGMSVKKLDELRRSLENPEDEAEKGIGLHNVYKRLQLFGGNNVKMEILSKEGQGTRIMIKLEMYTGDKNDNSIDCG